MWEKRKHLSDELMSIQTPKKSFRALNFQKIIFHQQEVIKQLQKQISHLRQYLDFVADLEQTFTDDKTDISASFDHKSESTLQSEKPSKKITGLKSLINEIMNLVSAVCPDDIINNIKKLDEKANKKLQPVFIQKIKQKQVPVYVEKIKEVVVEKVKLQEKIIYVDKPMQKMIDQPQLTVQCHKNSEFQEKTTKKNPQQFKQKDKGECSRWKMMERPNNNSNTNSTNTTNNTNKYKQKN